MKRDIYENIVSLYAQDIFRIAFSMVHIKEDAEDILQNVFYKLLILEKTFENQEHIRRWLIRVTVNECKNFLGSAWKRKVEYMDASYDLSDKQNENVTETLYEVKNCVFQLPAKLRIVIHLYYYEEYSTKEIADVLGILEPTVRSRLSRARKILKDMISCEGRMKDA